MPDGVLIRELPDGGHEFVLDDPVLSCLVIDDRVTFQFGRTDVTVCGPFGFDVDGVEHRCDTGRPESLAPVLSAYPGTVHWLWATDTGALTLVLMQGQRLMVPGPEVRSAWTVGAGPGRT